MSVWGIPEMYCSPNGAMGAATCTQVVVRMHPRMGRLEELLKVMERASESGGRDPKIMRSMQTMEPLSVTVDPVSGAVTWRQDDGGEKILNPRDQILTLNAADAVRFKVARGIAADRETLMWAMGIERVEWAGREASEALDQARKDADAAFKAAIDDVVGYVRLIGSKGEDRNQEERRGRVERARARIAALEKAVKARPNLRLYLAAYVGGRELDREFFSIERDRLRDLELLRVEGAPATAIAATAKPPEPAKPAKPVKRIFP
jgi:hypothetical protein